MTPTSPFDLPARELAALLRPGAPSLPELELARRDRAALREAPQTRAVLAQSEQLMAGILSIPQTPYTYRRFFARNGDRGWYEGPYFLKRASLGAAALRLFLGEGPAYDEQLLAAQTALLTRERATEYASRATPDPALYGVSLKDVVQDYLWSICEERDWVVPAHERHGAIDLFAAETGFALAETLALLGEQLDGEVRAEVRAQVERRILAPYLRLHQNHGWYKGHNNWNGVCNSSVAATFLLIEPEPARAAEAVAAALAGLRVYLDHAFEADGSSTEGVAYWHYGLINYVAMAELLAARSGGAIDLLSTDEMRRVAAYPAKVLLSGSHFASFSDCDEQVRFNPGIVARLAERTGERSLLGLLARPAVIGGDWRLPMMLRNVLWWDGRQGEQAPPGDAVLPAAGVARLVAATPWGAPVVLALKAGHNDENHNQNDVGSFVLHVRGESLLVDPGRGLYNRDYFNERRYENIFASSYGHSLPRIDGRGQAPGRERCGELLAVDPSGPRKTAAVEFARAYDAPELASARRTLSLEAAGPRAGTLWVEDRFAFAGPGSAVEGALVTWGEVTLDGPRATIRGERAELRLTIESPIGLRWRVERLEEQCRTNLKPGVLSRLSVELPRGAEAGLRVRVEPADLSEE